MLLNLPIAQPKMMLADKGYDGDEVRSSLLMHGILPVIPPKANRKQAISCDFTAYKDRNRIERMFNRLRSSGLLRGANPGAARFRCEIYRTYLQRHLA